MTVPYSCHCSYHRHVTHNLSNSSNLFHGPPHLLLLLLALYLPLHYCHWHFLHRHPLCDAYLISQTTGRTRNMTSPTALFSTMQALLDKREAQSGRRRLTVSPPDSVDFSSNDFLSLSKSALLRDAYLVELSRATEIPLGSGGSRLLDGNSHYAEEIEQQIASFHHAPAGLLFNSGFDANSGLFSCVPQPGDAIVYDEYIHASVHEGMRLSRAGKLQAFVHNSLPDLERVIRTIIASDSSFERNTRNIFVAVESVYSMDGDVAPIKEILDIIENLLPAGNGHLIVDEAHSTGVYGLSGRGYVSELGLEDRILARLHTFGKALSSGGGTVVRISCEGLG